MDTNGVLALLEAHQSERGIENWNKLGAANDGLESFGIGLTQLRKLAKQVGKDHALAAELWKTNVYDARVISILIDDPKLITPEQAEAQVEQLGSKGHLAHAFSTCGAPLAKAPFVVELADAWMGSDDPIRQDCGFGLLYEIAKSKKKSAPDDVYFLRWIEHIAKSFPDRTPTVRLAMGGALLGVGKRNAVLNVAALEVATAIGPIEFDKTGKCDPFDVAKHLGADALRKKLGVQ